MCSSVRWLKRSAPGPWETAKQGQNGKPAAGLPAKAGAWLELLRVPNLFTVPGDPLAGMFLAYAVSARSALPGPRFSWITAGFLILSSLMLYAAGLILNDYVDYAEDKIMRPHRPLPSYRITRSRALAAGILLLPAALVSAYQAGPLPCAAAAVLALCLLLYTFLLKHIPYLGALVMGLCRGINLMLGVVAVPGRFRHPLLLSAALVCTFYIWAVSILAKEETSRLPQGFKKYLPLAGITALVILAGCYSAPGFFHLVNTPMRGHPLQAYAFFIIPAIACFLLIRSFWIVRRMRTVTLKQFPGLIGSCIRLLIPIQAMFCFLGAFLLFAGDVPGTPGIPRALAFIPGCNPLGIINSLAVPCALCVCYLLAGRAGRCFYGS